MEKLEHDLEIVLRTFSGEGKTWTVIVKPTVKYHEFISFFFFWFFFSELGTEPRALRFLGKRSTTELNPQPPWVYF